MKNWRLKVKNRSIALFMGYTERFEEKDTSFVFNSGTAQCWTDCIVYDHKKRLSKLNLNYDKDWNELMPVVEEI